MGLELVPPPGAKWMELLIKGGTGADSRHMVTHTDTLSLTHSLALARDNEKHRKVPLTSHPFIALAPSPTDRF